MLLLFAVGEKKIASYKGKVCGGAGDIMEKLAIRTTSTTTNRSQPYMHKLVITIKIELTINEKRHTRRPPHNNIHQ